MTANEIYLTALGLLGESSNSAGDYDEEVVVQKLNVMLPEVFPYNENLRQMAGLAPLSSCPMLQSLADDIPFETNIVRMALPYGLASKLAYDDDEAGKASYFNGMMATILQGMTPFVLGSVIDLY